MKTKHLLKKLFPLTIILTFVFLFQNGSFDSIIVDQDKAIHQEKNSLQSGKIFQNNKFCPGQQNKKELSKENKNDNPELFAEYHNGIRTRYGDTKPMYPSNHKIKELLKAKGLASTKDLNKLTIGDKLLDWTERGPGNVSGRTRGIIIDPDDPTFDTWYVGSVGGGVWKTTDAGANWSELTPGLPNLATSTLAMAESNHDIIYMGTGEGFFNIDQLDGNGLWKSIDRGITWEQIESTANNPEFQNIMRIIIDPDNENILLVATGPGYNYFPGTYPASGIFKSVNGGDTWTKVFEDENHTVEHIIANPLNFNTQYATINSVGVIKSYDAGETWQDVSTGLNSFQRMEIAIAPTDTSRIYISAEGLNSGAKLFVSEDGAETWLVTGEINGWNVNWLGSQGWYDNTIAIDPYDEDITYVGGINLWGIEIQPGMDTIGQIVEVQQNNTSSFLSFFDWGMPWAGGGVGTGFDALGDMIQGVEDDDFVSVEVRFGPGKWQKAHRFIIGSGGGSLDYMDYIDVPFEIWDIDNNIQLMVSFNDIEENGFFDLTDEDPVTGGEFLMIHALPYDDTSPYPIIAQQNGAVYKMIYFIWPMLTQGATWDPNNLPESNLAIIWGDAVVKGIEITNITDGYGQYGGSSKGVHVDHHNIVLVKTDEPSQSFRFVNGNDGGVSYSDDKGETFTQPVNGYNTTQFYGVDKMNSESRYIGGTQDNGSWISPVDPGSTSSWVLTPGGDGFEAAWHYSDPLKILESSQFNNIYKTVDGGQTWSNASTGSGLTDVGGGYGPFFTKIAKSKQDPDLVFAVGYSGVWRSENFASLWTLISMPGGWIGNSSFTDIKISLVNPQIVWSGYSMVTGSPLYVSTNGGINFSETSVYPDVTLGRTSGIETHPVEDSSAFALFSFAKAPKILRTTDLGQTWEDISGFGTDTVSSTGFPDVAVFSLLVMPYDTDIIWAGTEIGIFETTDNAQSWHYIENGFPATGVW